MWRARAFVRAQLGGVTLALARYSQGSYPASLLVKVIAHLQGFLDLGGDFWGEVSDVETALSL